MSRNPRLLAALVLAIGLAVAACADPAGQAAPTATQGAALSTATAVATPTTVATPTAVPATTPTTAATATAATTPVASPSAMTPAASGTASNPSAAGTITYQVASGTTASYRVREQLARLNAPSDAVGKTSSVTGQIVLTPDGKVVSDQSKITVDMDTLQSDSSLRDGFVKRNTLQTSQYPTAEFVPTEVQGLSSPLPTSGQATFKLLGDLTVHGVTKPVTWDVTAQVQGNDVTGTATTTGLKFEDFGMSPPQAGAVLSVNDDITLQVDFHLTKGG